jgi:hypothetical protein
MQLGDGHLLELPDMKVFAVGVFFLFSQGLGFFLELLIAGKAIGRFFALAPALALGDLA